MTDRGAWRSATFAVVTGLAVTCLCLAPGARAQSLPESSEPIKLAMNEWTGQHITTRIAGEILERMGYKVEYVTVGYYPQMQALEDGSVTTTLELWLNTIGDLYDKAMQSGKVEDLGELGLAPGEGWFYPDYVEELCPGLPDWRALTTCAGVFATEETAPSGRLVDYPAEWGGNNPERIAALGLDFEAVPAGSEGALIALFKGAVERREPILMMFWSPHWLHAEYTGRFVQLPPYEPACVEDPGWGPNPAATYDCAWLSGHVKKLVWGGMKDEWPAAYRLLRRLQVTNEVQIPLMKAIDSDGQDLAETVKAWVDANEAVWRPWVDAAVNP